MTSPRKIQITKLARPTERSEKPLSCCGKERRTRHVRKSSDSRDFRPAARDALSSSLRETFASSRSNSPFLFFFPSAPFFPRALFFYLPRGGSQSFSPVSLILSCLPRKLYLGCFLSPPPTSPPFGTTGRLYTSRSLSPASRPSVFPSSLLPSHFSFVAAWRKVHFSRVTCRQRYKGICCAFANIT